MAQESLFKVEEIKARHEAEMLDELLAGYKKWKSLGEEEYAQAYQVLLHKFTSVE